MALVDASHCRAIGLRLRQPGEELWDRRRGVRTFGYHLGEGRHGKVGWVLHDQPIGYRAALADFRAAGVGPGSVFVDLGCGLGRGVVVAARLGTARAIGIERPLRRPVAAPAGSRSPPARRPARASSRGCGWGRG